MSPYVGDSLTSLFDEKPQAATRLAARRMAEKGGDRMVDLTIMNTPIRHGSLRSSWYQLPTQRTHFGPWPAYESGVATDVDYACLTGRTPVTTERGSRIISQVKVGERVLTQTGEWREVLAKTSFPAVEKPDLLDLEVAWRLDRSHRLTLTLDHRVLVRRGARNLWIPAGDLHGDDLLYHRCKVAHNQGTGPVRECEECGRRHRGRGKRYCSQACRVVAWAAGSSPHIGMKRSGETRALLASRSRERGAGVRLNRALARRGHRTRHERDVEAWLTQRGVEFDVQVPIGEHVVDFYLPATGEVIEADGAYWHQDQRRDVERDRAILAAAPGVVVTHLHFYEARFSPPIDPDPVAGVRYVVCNPGPRSFVDPESMEAVPILTRREWRYGDKRPEAHGKWTAKLYDLTVEGVHSFLAGGVVVSNSHVEYGTGLWGPKGAKYPIEPKKPGGFLKFMVDGVEVFARRVMHPGSPGQHMVAIAADVVEAETDGNLMDGPLREWARTVEASAG